MIFRLALVTVLCVFAFNATAHPPPTTPTIEEVTIGDAGYNLFATIGALSFLLSAAAFCAVLAKKFSVLGMWQRALAAMAVLLEAVVAVQATIAFIYHMDHVFFELSTGMLLTAGLATNAFIVWHILSIKDR